MADDDEDSPSDLIGTIRSNFKNPEVGRFLLHLPEFEAKKGLPDEFVDRLERLEEAERAARCSKPDDRRN